MSVSSPAPAASAPRATNRIGMRRAEPRTATPRRRARTAHRRARQAGSTVLSFRAWWKAAGNV